MAYIGKSIESGTFSVLDTSGNTYNGSNTTFSLGTQVGAAAQLLVSHDGVIQKAGTDYTLASGGASITFSTAPASGASIFIVEISGAVGGTITPADNSVGITQLNVSDGSNGQVLKTDGSGTLSFGTGFDADGAQVFNESGASVDFRVESNNDANCLIVDGSGDKVGIGEDVPEGKLHVFSGDASVGPNGDADELVVEGSGNSGISILSGNSSNGNIYFGDSGDDNIGMIDYEHNGNFMIFTAGTNEFARGNDNGILSTGGETSPEGSPGGINIDTNALDSNALTFKNSDVAHGFTSKAEADTFIKIGKADSSLGGMSMEAFKENGIVAIKMSGNADGTPDTTKSTSGNCIIEMHSYVRDGTTSGATSTSNGNLFAVFNGDTCRFIFDAEGDLHSDSGTTTFDAYEDAHLVRAFDLSHGRGVIDSKFDKFVAYNHEKLAELQLVGREKNGTPNHFINVTGMQRLHNGAIWQQYEKHNQLLEAVYDLAKEAVGEEKANAILEKHEVKRLQ